MRALIGAEVGDGLDSRYTLLVQNRAGYRNLCRLITRTHLRHGAQGKIEHPGATANELSEFSSGLVCLTGGDEGPLARIYRESRVPNTEAKARRYLEQMTGIFGKGNVFVELQRHFRRSQEYRTLALADLARSMKLPLLASNSPLYAAPEERPLQDVLTATRHLKTLDEAGRLLGGNSERHMKTPREMEDLFSDFPAAIANTSELSTRLEFTLSDLGYEFPRYPVPPGETEDSYLRTLVWQGAQRRYGASLSGKHGAQLERELKLIEFRKLSGYFLIVYDIVEFCRREKILAQGRGSAANSAVCYVLGITAVDPIGMGLLFERFLSEERDEMPDIDLDLPSGDQRERVIQHVYAQYGRMGAAMTANVITYRGRSAVRDVGKALGYDEATIGRLTSQINAFEWKDLKDKLEQRFSDNGFDLNERKAGHFFALTSQILNLPRHLGQHSGGMVVCQGELDSVVPLEPASMPGRVVVQWDKDDCADLGIIKIDLLGLGMMAVLEDTIHVIRESYGEEVDLAHLPESDPKVYDCLQRADTIGLFQVESRAQMSVLPRMKPTRFYDIVVQVAIIRPGPIVGQMLHPYLKRRQGLEEPVSLHPLLTPILERTLGVPLFQEQLIRIAMEAAGFTGGQAEELRRAFGFKRSEKRMREVEVQLREGMEGKGITGTTQERIIQAITSFALYGFPESHAASFALIAYASAYLKCHYLAAFTASILNNQPMGFYSPATLVKDAQRHGQRFRPVDVQKSNYRCTIEQHQGQRCVRLGMNYVRGLSKKTAHRIAAEREQKPFLSLRDLVLRVPELQRDEISILAELGALNALPKQAEDAHRRGALWQAELALRPAGELFEAIAEDSAPSPLSPMTPAQRTVADFSNSGISIGKHPMAFHRERLARRSILDAATAKQQRDGAAVKVAGCVITRQRPGTAKGFVFLSLEDETGIINIIVRPDLFDRTRKICTASPYLLIKGILQSTFGVISVKAGGIEELTLRDAAVMQSHDFH